VPGTESAVLEAYEKLIQVTINGKVYEVPENNTLLRILQYMNLDLAYSKYCWNGDCRNCAFRYISRKTGNEVEALGCQMRCFPNMNITRTPEGVELN
jgi:2Fe-2S iron-sulfur cluster protein